MFPLCDVYEHQTNFMHSSDALLIAQLIVYILFQPNLKRKTHRYVIMWIVVIKTFL